MCRPRKTSASSEMLRCSPMTRNRGQIGVETRPAVSRPSAVVAVSSRRATMPAALVAYHSPGPLKLIWPRSDGHDCAGRADQACWQSEAGEPARRCRRPDDRGSAGRVRVNATGCGNAGRRPAAVGRPPGARVENVVHPLAAVPPCARTGARRGEAAIPERDHRMAAVARRVRNDLDPPSCRRRQTRWRANQASAIRSSCSVRRWPVPPAASQIDGDATKRPTVSHHSGSSDFLRLRNRASGVAKSVPRSNGPIACGEFQRGPNGSWTVLRQTTISPQGVQLNLATGQTFAKNQLVSGIEVTTVLDRNCGNQ